MAELLKVSADSPEPRAIERAVQLIRRGEVVGVPTDTFYGLAADPFNLIQESNETNNAVVIYLQIQGQRVSIVDRPASIGS